MISEQVRLDYEVKSRAELNESITFARNARREMGRGNYKVAQTQAMEAEKHILEAKALLRSLNQLSEMERTNETVNREIKFEEEVNAQAKQLEELEVQLTHVKEAGTGETKPEHVSEEEEYNIKV